MIQFRKASIYSWSLLLVFLFKKDSQTLYLEQELESLKVVLDIKNKRIHEQDKKIVQIDKLVSSIICCAYSIYIVIAVDDDHKSDAPTINVLEKH